MTLAGLRLALAPAGEPLMERLMFWALPLVTAVEMVELPPLFCSKLMELGLALIEKSFGGGATTVNVTVAACVADEAAPVTVSV